MADAEERPLKRMRGSGCADTQELVRHETLYLEDGDIALTARSVDGQKRLVFRVDKIFLARHSPIFKDMLSFEPGQDAEDVYEGVPRVDLTDNAEDLAILLGGMYDVSTLQSSRFDPDKPVRMMGVIRLAMKYEIEGIKKFIIKDIEGDWPSSLSGYSAWRYEIDQITSQHPTDFWKYVPEPASAMQFATEFGCAEVTTAAMYCLARESPGTYITEPGSNSQRVRWHLLDSKNLYRVLNAQTFFRTYVSRFRTRVITPSKDCLTEHCGGDMVKIAKTHLHDFCDLLKFCTLVSDRSRFFGANSPCWKCLSSIDEQIPELEQDLWWAMQHCASSKPRPW